MLLLVPRTGDVGRYITTCCFAGAGATATAKVAAITMHGRRVSAIVDSVGSCRSCHRRDPGETARPDHQAERHA